MRPVTAFSANMSNAPASRKIFSIIFSLLYRKPDIRAGGELVWPADLTEEQSHQRDILLAQGVDKAKQLQSNLDLQGFGSILRDLQQSLVTRGP